MYLHHRVTRMPGFQFLQFCIVCSQLLGGVKYFAVFSSLKLCCLLICFSPSPGSYSCKNSTAFVTVSDIIFGQPFVKRFTLCYRSVVCLSVLSVTLVYCGQSVGQIKMKLGTQVGLGPGHNVLGGDPAPFPPKGHSPPIFGPYLLRPNGGMDQDATRHGARPRPRRLC